MKGISEREKLRIFTEDFNKNIEKAEKNIEEDIDSFPSCRSASRELDRAQFKRGRIKEICEKQQFDDIEIEEENGEKMVKLGACKRLEDDMRDRFHETNDKFMDSCVGD